LFIPIYTNEIERLVHFIYERTKIFAPASECSAGVLGANKCTPSSGIMSDFPADNQQRYLGMSDDVFRDRTHEHFPNI
jgi:hypothetical protein